MSNHLHVAHTSFTFFSFLQNKKLHSKSYQFEMQPLMCFNISFSFDRFKVHAYTFQNFHRLHVSNQFSIFFCCDFVGGKSCMAILTYMPPLKEFLSLSALGYSGFSTTERTFHFINSLSICSMASITLQKLLSPIFFLNFIIESYSSR